MALLDHVHIWLPFCMIELVRLCSPTVVSGGIPGPISNVNDRIMPMSDAVSSEGPEDHRHPTNILRTESSPVSLNLLMMLFTIDDEICKAFASNIEECCF